MTRIAFLLLLTAGVLSAADITGSWDGEVVTDAGTGNPSFTFKQDGSKLTGTYSGLLGQAKVSGVVEGNKVSFSFTADAQGQTLTVKYEGALEGDNLIKGKAILGDFGAGTFTLKKK